VSSTPEGKVKSRIDAVLNAWYAYFLKPVQNGMGAPALDYHGCHRGFAFMIEAKAPGKAPSPRQINTARKAHAAGGAVFLIDGDLTELSNWLALPFAGFISPKFLICIEKSQVQDE
jgi:hypothetical protein